MQVDLVVETAVSNSMRARQVSAMFDVPPQEKCRLEWKVQLPIDANDWNVGLIVGPSGSGKSSVMRHVFGEPPELKWGAPSVVDDVSPAHDIEAISGAFSAVGFNTIPAWMRPYAVLSNGERFRADIARRMLELPDPIVVDEFTSVVDRQIAQVASHAVQKYVRKGKRRFVAVTCHYDVIDWLQPDWVLDMATVSFQRRLLQRRPEIACEIRRLPFESWRVFAPFHYMSSSLHRAAQCFGLFCNGHLASICAAIHRPHPTAHDIIGCSRLVTLPDWQGLGLAPMLAARMGAAYKAIAKRFRVYPAHPALVRIFDRSPYWKLTQEPGGAAASKTSKTSKLTRLGGKNNAVFEYIGEGMSRVEATRLIHSPV